MSGPFRRRAVLRTVSALLLALPLVLLLALAPGAQAQDEGTTITTLPGDPVCVTCHASVSNDVVTTWRTQNHGRNQVACPVCHNTHETDFRPNPTAAVCLDCHQLAQVHPDMTAETPGERCMECHTANVHLMPGPESWFKGGLPRSRLAPDQPPPAGQVSASTARVASLSLLVVAVAVGLALGWVFVRLTRNV